MLHESDNRFNYRNSLGIEEGYFMILQVYHDIEKMKQKWNSSHPDLSKIRTILFWDTEMEKIDWIKQKKSIVKRVFERGNEEEKAEITRFYGPEFVQQILNESA